MVLIALPDEGMGKGAWGIAPGEGGVPRITEGSRGQGEGFPPKIDLEFVNV